MKTIIRLIVSLSLLAAGNAQAQTCPLPDSLTFTSGPLDTPPPYPDLTPLGGLPNCPVGMVPNDTLIMQCVVEYLGAVDAAYQDFSLDVSNIQSIWQGIQASAQQMISDLMTAQGYTCWEAQNHVEFYWGTSWDQTNAEYRQELLEYRMDLASAEDQFNDCMVNACSDPSHPGDGLWLAPNGCLLTLPSLVPPGSVSAPWPSAPSCEEFNAACWNQAGDLWEADLAFMNSIRFSAIRERQFDYWVEVILACQPVVGPIDCDSVQATVNLLAANALADIDMIHLDWSNAIATKLAERTAEAEFNCCN